MADTPLSFLDLVNQCDNFPPRSLKSEFDSEIIVPLFLTGTSASDEGCVGLLRPVIVELLQNENKKSQSEGKAENWIVNLNKPPRVSFNDHVETPEQRSTVMKELAERLRDEEVFPDVCGKRKWRDELYPIYIDPFGSRTQANLAFDLERSACALFGVVTYGVHMTMWVNPNDAGHFEIWTPKRSSTKQT